MKDILLDFWHFVKHPKDEQYTEEDKNYKWKVFSLLFVLKLFFLIIYVPLANVIDSNFEFDHTFEEKNYKIINVILTIVILAPLFEEILFRLVLRRTKKINKIITENTWTKYFPFLVYFSSIVFGIIHFGNYSNFDTIFIFVAPIMISTQILSGFILAFIRVRFSFILGYIFHAFWNFFVVFIIDGSYYFLKEDLVEIKNNTYELVIEPKQFLPHTPTAVYYNATIDTIYSLKTGTKSLNDLVSLIDPLDNKYYSNSSLVYFEFTSKKGIHKDSLLSILETEGYIEKQTPTN